MRTARDFSDARVLDLYPEQETCPECGRLVNERYPKRRFWVTLTGPLEVISHILECGDPACPHRGVTYRPLEEDLLALRGYTFGLDVVALIGQRRFNHHERLTQIQQRLARCYRLTSV